MSGTQSRLFQPMKLGPCNLSTRIVMGPVGSYEADENNVLSPAAAEYYSLRAGTPGTLIIAEATFVSAAAGGTPEPRAGIWTTAQMESWKNVVDRVHARGSYIWLQLWSLGRSADPECKRRDGTGDVVSSSAVPERGRVVPRPMREDEIAQYIDDYALAARNAVQVCGFDGVELHGGNGSLIDQFTQTVNQRTDGWGGSIEKRSRFALEITKAVCDAVGSARTGFRITPFSTYNDMGTMEDLIPQFLHLLNGLKDHKIAYLHLVESRIAGRVDVEAGSPLQPLTPFLDSWADSSPIILAGGYTDETAKAAVDEEHVGRDVAISFGRAFVTNPDLVQMLKQGLPLTS